MPSSIHSPTNKNMNDTPTPESDKAKCAFTSLFANDDAYWIPYVVGVKLERELAAVTAQRDEARIELEKYTTDSEDDALYNVRRLRKELATVTEQRDRLAKALQDLVASCNCIDSVDFMPVSMPEAFEKAQQALQSLTLNAEP
jgi:hypothetical protein